jgi:small subunit ribosomal protein S11
MLKKKNKFQQKIKTGIAHIKSTFNNTIITITDLLGNTLCWSSAGNCGFKGSKKSTAFAAQVAAKDVGAKAKNLGIEKLNIIFYGQGDGKDSALQSFTNSGLIIISLKDKTSIAHNGCRSPKKRRL